MYVANLVAVALPPGCDGFVNKSLVRFGAGVRISPLIASHISRILAVNWIRSSHCPQCRPSSVGMRNLLISILLSFTQLFQFLRMKGAYTSRYQMPREFVYSWCCLACRTKGVTLADARCLSLNNCEVGILKGRWRVDWRPYKIVRIYGMEPG